MVYHHANTSNPERCFVQLFKNYVHLCPDTPEEIKAFIWNQKRNQLQVAGILQYHLDTTPSLKHSPDSAQLLELKVSKQTILYEPRLYQSGVDEQLVMERTGHRSLEGVRSYKRTSTQQLGAISDILNRKEPRLDNMCTSTSLALACTEPQQPPASDVSALVL